MKPERSTGPRGAALRYGLVAFVAAAAGFALGRGGGQEVGAPAAGAPPASTALSSASPAVVATPPSPPSASSPAAPADEDDVASRARDGDLPALKALEARAPGARTLVDAAALEAGHAALARREARRLVDDLAADPSLFEDPTTLAHAYRLALDAAVAPTLLAGLAELRHPAVADLLFDLVQRGEPGGRLVLLAEDLLLGVARPRASSALDVTLRARAARSCEQIAALLPKIAADADDRVLSILEPKDARTGCGPKGADDCHVCLREPAREASLEAARAAARGRPFAPAWALGRK